MPSVTLVHWNPSRPVLRGRLGALVPIRRKVNNFGDLIGPMVVEEILRRRGVRPEEAVRDCRLFSVGSLLRQARQGDTVWGTGANGKYLDEFVFSDLDVRAVRGPLTQRLLRDRGIAVPDVVGDPGLLVGTLWSRAELQGTIPDRAVTVVPNLNDVAAFRAAGVDYLDPRSHLDVCLGTIAASSFVTGSSLHAIVVAEALGIPARLVRSAVEPVFKYRDYYQGSGRDDVHPAKSVTEALEQGGEPPISWDPQPLLDAFPGDLWASPLRRAA